MSHQLNSVEFVSHFVLTKLQVPHHIMIDGRWWFETIW